MLLNYHIGRFVLSSLCVWDLVRLVLGGVRFAGWSLQHGHYPNPTAPISNTQRNKNKTTNVVIQQHIRKLLMMVILMSETCWVHKKWNKIASDVKLVFYSSTITMMHGPINIRFQNTLDSVILLHVRNMWLLCQYTHIATILVSSITFVWIFRYSQRCTKQLYTVSNTGGARIDAYNLHVKKN